MPRSTLLAQIGEFPLVHLALGTLRRHADEGALLTEAADAHDRAISLALFDADDALRLALRGHATQLGALRARNMAAISARVCAGYFELCAHIRHHCRLWHAQPVPGNRVRLAACPSP
jgi:hypothetical protein